MHKLHYILLCFVLLIGLSPISNCIAKNNYEPNLALTPSWQNKYVTEGRNNLDTGGIFSLDASTRWSNWSIGAWFAQGDSEAYQEVNMYIEYTFDLHSIESNVSFTHLIFPQENENDNEISIGLSYPHLGYVLPSIDYTWSSQADGGFLEISLSSDLSLAQSKITLTPYILQAFDFGYATSDHDGPNNLQVGVGTNLQINNYLSFNLDLNHSWAQNDIDREGMDDVTWFNISLNLNI